jgi:hypothetical protein
MTTVQSGTALLQMLRAKSAVPSAEELPVEEQVIKHFSERIEPRLARSYTAPDALLLELVSFFESAEESDLISQVEGN